MKKVIFAFICLFGAVPCAARVIIVDANGTGDYPTIQAAINDANNGDTIELQPGIYTGAGNKNIDFLGKAITVRSADPNDPNVVAATVIDCEQNGRGFYFHNDEEENTILDGFTITNGFVSNGFGAEGGAISCYFCDVTISNCLITNNCAEYIGGGVYFEGGKPTIRNCTIKENVAHGNSLDGGGGIACSRSSPQIYNCVISDNKASSSFWHATGGGIYCEYNSNPAIINCILEGNSATYGAGIFCAHWCKPDILNCTLIGNKAVYGGGGITALASDHPKIVNCIFWNNTAGVWGPEISVESGLLGESPSQISVSYSDVRGGQTEVYVAGGSTLHWGPGNINNDPCVAETGYRDANNLWVNGDYHLKSEAGRWDPNSESWVTDGVTSPCIDAGNPGCPLGDEPNNPNNIRINMSAYGGTVEASKTPANWRDIADLTNDWIIDFNDLAAFVGYWLDSGECVPSDLNRNQSVDFIDFAIFGLQYSDIPASEPGIEYEISPCVMGLSATEQSGQTRFTVTVEGRYIHFEDMMAANCCSTERWLEMYISNNQITIYEHEWTMMPCTCICDFPITATIGPLEPGTYILGVIEDYGGFIGSTTFTIGVSQ